MSGNLQKKKYKVSVIVPVYNVEKYIGRCLESLLGQTLQDIEIIVVNDGSPDRSKEIILAYRQAYRGRIVYLEKENGGLSDARNFGLPYASGEYVAFLDSDDYADPGMYEALYEASGHGEKDVAECDFLWEYPSKTVEDSPDDYKNLRDYLVRGRVVAWNKIYRREWLLETGVLFPKGLIYEDVDFFFSLMPRLGSLDKFSRVKKPFVHYVQRNDSISSKESDRIIDLCRVYADAARNMEKAGLYSDYRQEIEYKFARNALWGFPIKKVRHIKARKKRKEILQVFWKEVNTKFPSWKQNIYLQKKGAANLYLRHVTEKTYYVIFMM